MAAGLYDKLLRELAGLGTVRTFTLMLQNEPLLDPNLATRVRLAREALGRRATIDFVTNGELLTPDRIDELIGAGVDRISVSIDALSEGVYSLLRPGLPFSTVVRNTERLVERRHEVVARVRFLRQPENMDEVDAFRRHWTDLGAEVKVTDPVNRAGALATVPEMPRSVPDSLRFVAKKLLRSVFVPCRAPFRCLNVLADGRVILCCSDWIARSPVGDLSTESLARIWNGDRLARYRGLLARWRWQLSDICAGCSVVECLRRSSPGV
jgi:MoaA/NifB/PqqE/SkfB family radical SAM enzyme